MNDEKAANNSNKNAAWNDKCKDEPWDCEDCCCAKEQDWGKGDRGIRGQGALERRQISNSTLEDSFSHKSRWLATG